MPTIELRMNDLPSVLALLFSVLLEMEAELRGFEGNLRTQSFVLYTGGGG